MDILEGLTKSEAFNAFLNDKLKTSKRFGVEGLDSMISGLSRFWLIQTNWLKRPAGEEWSTLDWEWLTGADLAL